jgi:hypothetical protein
MLNSLTHKPLATNWRIGGRRYQLQGVQLAGPDPLLQPSLTIQRKVSSRGGIQVGFSHAGQTVTV